MNKEHNNENKNDEEDTLTLAKLFSNWYVGAVVGFALGTLKGDLTTASTLTAYLAGAFGTAGDKEADDFCIRQLLPNKLKDQYCFKTESAIRCLKFVKGEKIWLK